MKQTNTFTWTRLLRVMVAMMTIVALLLCGCGKKKDEAENNDTQKQIQGIKLGDGDGKLEAQDVVDGVSTVYGQLLASLGNGSAAASGSNGGMGAEMSMTVTLGDTVLSMLNSAIAGYGMDFDLSWLETIGLKMNMNYDDELMQMIMGLNLNGEQLLSLDVIMDMAASMMYMGIPELNDEYLGGEMDMSDLQASAATLQDMMTELAQVADKLPSEEEVNALLTKYMNVAIEALGDPAVGNETLSYGGISQNVTATTYTIRLSDVLNVAIEVLETAQNDQDLEKVLDALSEALAEIDMDGEGYDLYQELMAMLPEALEEVRGEKADLAEEEDTVGLTFVTYTDGDTQVGLKLITYAYSATGEYDEESGQWTTIRSEAYETEFYYYSLHSGDNTAFVLEMAEALHLAGTGTVKNGKANGTYTLTQNQQGETVEIMDIEVKDFDTEMLSQGIFKGTLRLIPSEELMEEAMGLSGFLSNPVLEIVMDLNAETADMAVNLYNGSSLLVGLAFNTKTTDDANVNAPNDYTDITDSTALSFWVMGMDFDNILDNLDDAGVPDELLDMLESALEQMGL